jgi:hypothetical protein
MNQICRIGFLAVGGLFSRSIRKFRDLVNGVSAFARSGGIIYKTSFLYENCVYFLVQLCFSSGLGLVC